MLLAGEHGDESREPRRHCWSNNWFPLQPPAVSSGTMVQYLYEPWRPGHTQVPGDPVDRGTFCRISRQEEYLVMEMSCTYSHAESQKRPWSSYGQYMEEHLLSRDRELSF